MSALKTDTITAIATVPGRSALALIRISGPDSFSIADKILTQARQTSSYTGHTLHRAKVIDGKDTVDDVLVAVFHAPSSFSGENTVEITCHGGPVAVRRILALLLDSGARLADPGEFTLRAFLNGKLDLAQAEAVIDTIDARTDTALRLAGSQRRGDLSRESNGIRDSLVEILTRIEATIDFPEDVGDFPTESCSQATDTLAKRLNVLIESSKRGMLYREGLSVVLAGAPNAGKSSLLNALLRSDRAIVTSVPGTTRDIIEEILDIAGIPVRLTDTAGLRETSDEVEKIGVERTHIALDQADIIVEVRDITEGNSSAWFDQRPAVPKILVLSKCDLPHSSKSTDSNDKILLSAKTGEGLDLLEARIAEIALGTDSQTAGDDIVVTHARHKNALVKAQECLSRAQGLLESGDPLDLLSIEITSALAAVGEITGETAPEEIVNEIFHRFCIGK